MNSTGPNKHYIEQRQTLAEWLDSGGTMDTTDRLTVNTILQEIGIVRTCPDACSCGEMTALMWAATNDEVDACKWLVHCGATIDLKNKWGQTALRMAASELATNAVAVLWELGANVRDLDKYGNGLIISVVMAEGARKMGSEPGRLTEMLKLLVGLGADVNTSSGYTSLIWAAAFGVETIVSDLVEMGANVNTKGPDGCTALLAAVSNGHADVINTLALHGADIDAKNAEGVDAFSIAIACNIPSSFFTLAGLGVTIDLGKLDKSISENVESEVKSFLVRASLKSQLGRMAIYAECPRPLLYRRIRMSTTTKIIVALGECRAKLGLLKQSDDHSMGRNNDKGQRMSYIETTIDLMESALHWPSPSKKNQRQLLHQIYPNAFVASVGVAQSVLLRGKWSMGKFQMPADIIRRVIWHIPREWKLS